MKQYRVGDAFHLDTGGKVGLSGKQANYHPFFIISGTDPANGIHYHLTITTNTIKDGQTYGNPVILDPNMPMQKLHPLINRPSMPNYTRMRLYTDKDIQRMVESGELIPHKRPASPVTMYRIQQGILNRRVLRDKPPKQRAINMYKNLKKNHKRLLKR